MSHSTIFSLLIFTHLLCYFLAWLIIACSPTESIYSFLTFAPVFLFFFFNTFTFLHCGLPLKDLNSKLVLTNLRDGTVHSPPITLLCCWVLLRRKWWIHSRCFQMRQRKFQTARSQHKQPVNVIFLWIEILIFPNSVPQEHILPCKFWIQEVGSTLLYWQLRDHKVFIYLSFFSFILHCCRSAKRIWNIYQGIVCWRHSSPTW